MTAVPRSPLTRRANPRTPPRPDAAAGLLAVAIALGAVSGLALIGTCQEPAGDTGAAGTSDTGVAPRPLAFVRVHVPSGRLADVPFGSDRYVPMSAREFEEGVSRLAATGASRGARNAEPAPGPLATSARYVVEPSADGGLEGRVEFDVGWPGEGDAPEERRTAQLDGMMPLDHVMPLVGLQVRSGVMRTAAGIGEAVVFGRRDGSLAMATPAAGSYGCRFRAPPASDPHRLRLRLVPALSSSIQLVLPRGLAPTSPLADAATTPWERAGDAVAVEPVVAAPVDAAPPRDDRVVWRIATGPRATLDVVIMADDMAPRPVTLWSDVAIQGRQVRLDVRAMPATAWTAGPLRLDKDPEVLVTSVAGGAAAAMTAIPWTVDGDAIVVDLPPRLAGGREPLVINAVAPLASTAGRVPALRVPAPAWRGGGTVIRLAPALTVAGIETEHCVVVAPETAAAWPLPDAGAVERSRDRGAAAAWPARYCLEHQSPLAAVVLTLEPRLPVIDVARVTTVDLSAGTVVARAACDVRVERGEAFDVTARVTAGWFIDAVEPLATPVGGEPGESARRREAADPAGEIEWKLQRDGRGDVLRIGLAAGAMPGRGLLLRITGHRAGVPLESDFSTADIDMVRFDAEAERSALLELRTGPETTVEFEATDPVVSGPEGRLAALAEEGPVRARAWAGHRAASRMARLVRRRPPLDARTEVRLTVRDDRLTESFMFDCRPAGSDLDSILVQFSQASDEPLEWSLLPPAVGSVAARRLDANDRRGGAAGGDRWLVELTPAARGPVSIRAARTTAFTRRTTVPLVWVDGATTATGTLVVRDVGRSRLKVVNHRLAELPPVPPPPGADASAAAAMEFSFDPRTAADAAEEPAAELLPWGGDARACAWREIISSWCHASGETEHETLFEIDNHGRTTVTIEVRRGHRLDGVLLDGVRLALGEGAAAAGSMLVELPVERRLVELLVRTVAAPPWDAGSRAAPWWTVDPAPVRLADVPVLRREWVLMLPPDLEILDTKAAVRLASAGDDAGPRDWAARLLAAAVRTPADATGGVALPAPAGAGTPRQGFRQFLVVPEGPASAGVTVIEQSVMVGGAAAAAVAWGAVVLVILRLRPRAAVLALAIAGVAALWGEPPLAGILRAAWWSGLATWLLASWPRTGPVRGAPAVTAAILAALAGPGATGAVALEPDIDEPLPLRVFIMSIPDGDGTEATTALVPERIFRLLVRGDEPRPVSAAARVVAARVTAAIAGDGGAWGTFRLAIDVDADTEGELWLDQAASGARFVAGDIRLDGMPITCEITADGRLLRTRVLDAGRHTIDVGVAPAVERRGDVETATMSLPVAPRGTLRLAAGTPALDGAVCERAAEDDGFMPAPRVTTDADMTTFDVSGATGVRLVRALVGGRLAETPRSVASRNDIIWNRDECRLTASFVVDPGDAILRGVVVRADDGLEWMPPADGGGGDEPGRRTGTPGVAIRPLGSGRFHVEFAAPDRAVTTFEMAFRRPLATPVGVFDVPGAWLERAVIDVRAVRLAASPALSMRVDLPPGLTPVAVSDGDASFETRAWRGELVRPAAHASPLPAVWDPHAGEQRARLVTERRPQAIRDEVQQRQTVVFATEHVRLHLDARFDSSSSPLVTLPLDVPPGCVIDRVTLSEEDGGPAEALDRAAIDVRLARPADTRGLLVVQRPRAGRFRLEIDARLPGRPLPRGSLPRLQVAAGDSSRTRIDWRTEDAQQARVGVGTASGPAATAGQVESAAGDVSVAYVLEPAGPLSDGMEAAAPPAAAVAGNPAAAPRAARVELADIRLSVDSRGGMWGIAAFDLVAEDKSLALELPAGWRLFDVSVDGKPVVELKPVAAAERGTGTFWEVRLLDAGWPRSVVALFKGDLGPRALLAEPLTLVAPAIVGLPVRKVMWTLDLPPGVTARAAEPAHVVPGHSVTAERRAARQRLDDAFAAVLERAAGTDRERLWAFELARQEGTMPVADAVWNRPLAAGAPRRRASPRSIVVVGGEDDAAAAALTVRLARVHDATVPGRAVATAVLVAAALLTRFGGARRGAGWLSRAGDLLPFAALPAGLAWMAWLVPVWPGAALCAAGTLAIAARGMAWLRRGSAAPRSGGT